MTTPKIVEIFDTPKAGIVPVYVKDGRVYGVFMVPSDPRYGGTNLNIAKGEIDPGETVEEAAWREGTEELGLIPDNCNEAFLVGTWDWPIRNPKIPFSVYATIVNDPSKWNKPHFETKAVYHTPLFDFRDKLGRSDQREMIKSLILSLATSGIQVFVKAITDEISAHLLSDKPRASR